MTCAWLKQVQEELTEVYGDANRIVVLQAHAKTAIAVWRKSKSGHEYWSRYKCCTNAIDEIVLGSQYSFDELMVAVAAQTIRGGEKRGKND